MLAQSFQTAADMEITEPQKEALIKTLVLLETGKLVHASKRMVLESPEIERAPSFSGLFNMRSWGADDDFTSECGTIACIGGTADLIAGEPLFALTNHNSNKNLYELFYPPTLHWDLWYDITPAQAATALRNYLTTGDARWDLAVAS